MNTPSGIVPSGAIGGMQQQQQQQQQQGVVVPKFIGDAARQNVVLRLEEAMRSSGKTTAKTGFDLEQTIFSKTATPEAYHNMVERCIQKLREPSQPLQQRQQQQLQQQQLIQQQNIVYSDQLQLQQQQQDPNNGSGNMMPQHPVPQQQLPVGQQQQQMRMPVSQQQQQQMMMNQQNSSMAPTAGQMMRPIMNPSQGGGGSQLQQRLTGGGSGNPRMSVGPQMMPGGVQRIGMNNMMNQRMMGPMAGMAGPSVSVAAGGVTVPGGVPTSNLAVSGAGGMMTSRGPPPMYMNPSPHMVQGGSPANMGMMGHSPMNNQYIHSPASQPNTSMPSPAGPRSMAPSPISNVNTPQTNEQPASQEDQQYLEKVKQLGKYIVPLKKMIDSSVDQANLEKMTRLMEILSNPNKKKMPMETLMRCETVLMKIIPPDSISDAMPMLMDAINSLRASSKSQPGSLNHVLQKTLGAPLEAIYGSEISLPPLPKKKKMDHGHSSQGSDIPDVIQGEIARLRSQFKVNLDPSQPSQKSNIIHLTCQLEDPNLPSVPPISVTLPPSYPETSPICDAEMTEYYSTPFLSKVQEALTARLGKMPARFTLSQLLSAWEMSVRAACSPKSIQQLASGQTQLTVS